MEFNGEFTDLNTYIAAERGNRFAAAEIKRDETDRVQMGCLSEENSKQAPITKPCFVCFEWYTRNERKDADNVAFAKKFILDGLVKAGILKDDTRKFVLGFTDNFKVDSDFPRVMVSFEEV